jgi:hypothetical protein
MLPRNAVGPRHASTLAGWVLLTSLLVLVPPPALAQGGGGGGLSPDQQAKILDIKVKALDMEVKAQQLVAQSNSSKVTKAAEDIALRARRIYDIGERILSG